jgi:uncharacterized membrane protein YccC
VGAQRAFAHELVHLEPARLDLRRGVLGASLVLIPLVIGFALGLAEASVLVTIGALNLLLVQLPTPAATRWRVLMVGVVANTVAFGAGTLVGLAPVTLEIPLVAVAILFTLLGTRNPEWEGASFIAAVMFCFAVGIPPTTLAGVVLRPAAVLLGGTWTLAVLSVVQLLWPRFPSGVEKPSSAIRVHPEARMGPVLTHSTVVAVTVAAGLLVGVGLGLPRDYWIMLTVLVALRVDLASTVNFAAARIAGTVAGASVAFVVTTWTASPWILFPILALTTAFCLATRGVNYAVYAVWITLTVILLLNLVYSGGPTLAIARVIDTLIGGALSLVAAFALATTIQRRSSGPSTAPQSR